MAQLLKERTFLKETVVVSMCGFIQILVGAWILIDTGKAHLYYSVVAEIASLESIMNIAYFITTVGVTILFIGLLGCCAVAKDNRWLLGAYFISLTVLVASNLSISIGTAFYRQHILTGLEERLYRQLVNHYGYWNKDLPESSESKVFSQAIDYAQYSFNCCGIFNDNDFLNSKWRNRSSVSNDPRNVPASCCVLANKHDVSITRSPISAMSGVFHGTVEKPWQNPQPKNGRACQNNDYDTHQNYRYKQGCFTFIDNWFKIESNFIVFLCLSAGLLQILGIIASVFVCRDLNEEQT